MAEGGEGTKQFYDPTKNEKGLEGTSVGRKTIGGLRKFFIRNHKQPLELPVIEISKIPSDSKLAKLVSDWKQGDNNQIAAAAAMERNYHHLLTKAQNINSVVNVESLEMLKEKIISRLNEGDIRTIAALTQQEYREIMSKRVHNPNSLEQKLINKKIDEKAQELLNIRAQATAMKANLLGVYEDATSKPLQYWMGILNPPEVKGKEEEVIVNKLVDQDLAEVLASKNSAPLEGESKEE